MSRTILALDLGTKLGWCLSEQEAGVENLAQHAKESPGMRYLRFRRWLHELLDSGIDVVAYEDVRRHEGTTAAHVYGALEGILLAELEAKNGAGPSLVGHVAYGVGEIKRFATGKGNANKDAMLAAARRQWGPEVADDNEADARFIWALARHDLGKD